MSDKNITANAICRVTSNGHSGRISTLATMRTKLVRQAFKKDMVLGDYLFTKKLSKLFKLRKTVFVVLVNPARNQYV